MDYDGRWDLAQMCQAAEACGHNGFACGVAWVLNNPVYAEVLSDADEGAISFIARKFAELQATKIYVAAVTAGDAEVHDTELVNLLDDAMTEYFGVIHQWL